MFEVKLHPEAVQFIKKLDDKIQTHIKKKLRLLKSDPRRNRPGVDTKKLSATKGKQLYRLRVGKYRFIYAVEGDTVWVTDAFVRGRGYRNL